jgi:hypothetical protein
LGESAFGALSVVVVDVLSLFASVFVSDFVSDLPPLSPSDALAFGALGDE